MSHYIFLCSRISPFPFDVPNSRMNRQVCQDRQPAGAAEQQQQQKPLKAARGPFKASHFFHLLKRRLYLLLLSSSSSSSSNCPSYDASYNAGGYWHSLAVHLLLEATFGLSLYGKWRRGGGKKKKKANRGQYTQEGRRGRCAEQQPKGAPGYKKSW